ncbi:phosphoribosylglycinamide formyltransferase [Phenylobacterium sp.]|uniref:phosphoribosylglycinamide formyltransferase n=1 Tax=Phenylobacterium sp. TaxID=1871053 RepID=UPI0037C81AA1
MTVQLLKLGFLASRNGSSARAICEAIQRGELSAEARLMVSNRRDAGALDWARTQGLPSLWAPTVGDPDAADARLAEAMRAHGVNLIILSGYLRHLGPRTLEAFKGRILNIHPGPLPEFGGEGMYGRRVHEAVIDAGVSRSAIVIHGVDEVYDRGPELTRRWVDVEPGDTVDSLESRVTALEPVFFVETLKRLSEGVLVLA